MNSFIIHSINIHTLNSDKKMETTNNLTHRINTNDLEGNPLEIDIRLNDECKNGHEDFAITATA